MIESIESPSLASLSGWGLTQIEHEVATLDGSVVDIKARYHVTGLLFQGATLELRLAHDEGGPSVALRWFEVAEFHVIADSDYPGSSSAEIELPGLIGIRLLDMGKVCLYFQIDGDDFTARLSCHAFRPTVG